MVWSNESQPHAPSHVPWLGASCARALSAESARPSCCLQTTRRRRRRLRGSFARRLSAQLLHQVASLASALDTARERECVCVCERERESECVCVRERERERESACVCVRAASLVASPPSFRIRFHPDECSSWKPFSGNWSLSFKNRLTAPMPWGRIVFMSSPLRPASASGCEPRRCARCIRLRISPLRWMRLESPSGVQLSSEYGTYEKVWPWLSGQRPGNLARCSLFARLAAALDVYC
jgi:hypothetical protein